MAKGLNLAQNVTVKIEWSPVILEGTLDRRC